MATNQGGGQRLEHNAADQHSVVYLIIAFDAHVINSTSRYYTYLWKSEIASTNSLRGLSCINI